MVAPFPSCRRLAQATGLWAIILSQCSGPDSAMAHVGSANAAFVGPHMAAGLGSSFPPAGEPSPRVRSLHRFAVKGLGGDCLSSVVLGRGETFPHDREWALLKVENGDKFDAQAPKWLHKENFECAFTAGEALLQLDTTFDDESCTLSLAQKMPPHRASRTNMLVAEEVLALESFLQEHVLGGRGVKVVRGGGEKRAHVHQFGNTRSGVRHNNDTRTVHIVNADTVAEVSRELGMVLDPARFRANIVVEGLPAWAEFDWVTQGHPIRIGTASLDVISRTVRCDGVNVDLATGKRDCDLPALLTKHFPQHGPYLGVYAQVAEGGRMECGDEVLWAARSRP